MQLSATRWGTQTLSSDFLQPAAVPSPSEIFSLGSLHDACTRVDMCTPSSAWHCLLGPSLAVWPWGYEVVSNAMLSVLIMLS